MIVDKVWTRRLESYTQFNSSSGRVIETEMMMLSDRIVDIIKYHKDFKITLTGKLVKLDGTEERFSMIESFVANKRSVFTTYWKVLSSL